MEIIYIGNDLNALAYLKTKQRTFLALRQDWWDDYGFKTYFQAFFVVDGEDVEIDSIRILFAGEETSLIYLNDRIKTGWNGVFPLESSSYISVPCSVDFYKVIEGKLGKEEALQTARKLRDASHLVFAEKDERAVALTKSAGFETSLQRESGSIKAFQDGWEFFEEIESKVVDFNFTFKLDVGASPIEIRLKFNSPILPYDINVLVGPNGIGKSQALQNLVEFLLRIERGSPDTLKQSGFLPFSETPNFSHIIVVSYSPFEMFILDVDGYNIRDKEVYKYFGFRNRRKTADGRTSIGLSRNRPAQDSVESLIKCVKEDQDFEFISDWVNKVRTVEKILSDAIQYDHLAIEIDDSTEIKDLFRGRKKEKYIVSIGKKKYLIVNDQNLRFLNLEQIDDAAKKLKGVIFIENDEVKFLSSGQRLYTYIVLNIVGSIKKNSLIIVDEPELFLHPNLEIGFISLLKEVLTYFKSKAILATHSLITVREVPRKCVHVMMKAEDATVAVNPPFETFGGDIQRISSYVFGDKSLTKPYEEWLEMKLEEYGSADSVIDALGSEVNEETIIHLASAGMKIW